jgi:hypothetical protein
MCLAQLVDMFSTNMKLFMLLLLFVWAPVGGGFLSHSKLDDNIAQLLF